jgi:hypothetical protein
LSERRVSISGDGADDVVWTESSLRIRRDEKIEGTEVAVVSLVLDEGVLQVKDGYANPVSCRTAANLADGRFHQVVWSLHRSTGSFEVFIDDRLCQSQTSERSRATHPLTELLIGGAYGGGPFRRFVGALDDFRIYSRLLSAKEAAALTP